MEDPSCRKHTLIIGGPQGNSNSSGSDGATRKIPRNAPKRVRSEEGYDVPDLAGDDRADVSPLPLPKIARTEPSAKRVRSADTPKRSVGEVRQGTEYTAEEMTFLKESWQRVLNGEIERAQCAGEVAAALGRSKSAIQGQFTWLKASSPRGSGRPRGRPKKDGTPAQSRKNTGAGGSSVGVGGADVGTDTALLLLNTDQGKRPRGRPAGSFKGARSSKHSDLVDWRTGLPMDEILAEASFPL